MDNPAVSIWHRQFFPHLSLFRFLRWLFSWRMIRRYLFCLACLATLAAIFYAVENWRGHHAWQTYKQAWEAKGDKFDWRELIPPPVPDDQNFAMTPFFADCRRMWYRKNNKIMDVLTDAEQKEDLMIRLSYNRADSDRPSDQPELSRWDLGTNTDLASWQAYYRYRKPADPRAALRMPRGPKGKPSLDDAPENMFPIPAQPTTPAADVLLALGKCSNALQELRTASQRPASRFPVNYDDGFQALLPQLSKVKQAALYLHLLNVAELATGQSTAAASNVNLMFYLSDSLRTEPFLISYLVRISMFDPTLSSIWEGLGSHRWSDEQLVGFQAKIERLDLLADYLRVVQGERALDCQGLDELAALRMAAPIAGDLMEVESRSFDGSNEAEHRQLRKELYLRLAPKGWFDQNKLNCAILIRDKVIAPVDPQSQRVNLKLPESAETARRSRADTAYTFLARWFVPVLSGSTERAVRSQTALNLADVACALERYWLAHAQYPDQLDQLAPQFIKQLPHEITNGQPLRYFRSHDRYVLYSVGLDREDFGGVSRTVDGKPNGNWVWSHPSGAESTR